MPEEAGPSSTSEPEVKITFWGRVKEIFVPTSRSTVDDLRPEARPMVMGENGEPRQPRILFVDPGNINRSIMAEKIGPRHGLFCESAGTFPSKAIPQETFDVMAEAGYDMSDSRPKIFDIKRMEAFDRIILMGNAKLPKTYPPPQNVEEWTVPDPHGMPMSFYRDVRGALDQKIRRLARSFTYKAKHKKGRVVAVIQN